MPESLFQVRPNARCCWPVIAAVFKEVVKREVMLHIFALRCAIHIPWQQLAAPVGPFHLQRDDILQLLVPPHHCSQPLVVSQDNNLRATDTQVSNDPFDESAARTSKAVDWVIKHHNPSSQITVVL